MAKLVGNVASFDVAEVAHPAHEFLAIWIVIQGSGSDVSDTGSLPRLLHTRRERPGDRAAKERDERPPFHSITSSARASKVAGTSRPSACAVIRFTTSSNLVGCSTGSSLGFVPRRILSTNSAARRNWAGKSAP